MLQPSCILRLYNFCAKSARPVGASGAQDLESLFLRLHSSHGALYTYRSTTKSLSIQLPRTEPREMATGKSVNRYIHTNGIPRPRFRRHEYPTGQRVVLFVNDHKLSSWTATIPRQISALPFPLPRTTFIQAHLLAPPRTTHSSKRTSSHLLGPHIHPSAPPQHHLGSPP
jgi:hypothetical protein